MGEGGAAGQPSHWKVLRRSPSTPVAGPEPAAVPFFLSPQVRAALRSRSERASRQSRGRRRLWEQLRAAWGRVGWRGRRPSSSAASQLESGVSGSREERGPAGAGARLGHPRPAAPVPSRFRPFWVTSTPLYRPHLSGAARTAPWGRGGGGDTARADWALAAAVVRRGRRTPGPGTRRPGGPGSRRPPSTRERGIAGYALSRRGHVSRVRPEPRGDRVPPPPPARPLVPGRPTCRAGSRGDAAALGAGDLGAAPARRGPGGAVPADVPKTSELAEKRAGKGNTLL